jgi:hypothetical protein
MASVFPTGTRIRLEKERLQGIIIRLGTVFHEEWNCRNSGKNHQTFQQKCSHLSISTFLVKYLLSDFDLL